MATKLRRRGTEERRQSFPTKAMEDEEEAGPNNAFVEETGRLKRQCIEKQDGPAPRTARQKAQHQHADVAPCSPESTSDDDTHLDNVEPQSSEDEPGGRLAQEIADLPLELVEQLRHDGRGCSGKAARAAAHAAKEQQKGFKRLNRHRPAEQSSKRPVARFKEVIQVANRQVRDPRFEESVKGPKEDEKFRKRYSFVFNEVLPREQEELSREVQRERDPSKKAALQRQLSRTQQQLRQEQLRRQEDKVKQDWKNKEVAAVTTGKQPYFLKPSQVKQLALVARYQELKQAGKGKLDKFMEKRRKKNAAKDHRYIPSHRRGES